jgi:hypothetical protein
MNSYPRARAHIHRERRKQHQQAIRREQERPSKAQVALDRLLNPKPSICEGSK